MVEWWNGGMWEGWNVGRMECGKDGMPKALSRAEELEWSAAKFPELSDSSDPTDSSDSPPPPPFHHSTPSPPNMPPLAPLARFPAQGLDRAVGWGKVEQTPYSG